MAGTASNWCKKKNFRKLIKGCQIDINGLETCVNLNILPLETYDILIGMDWLEQHHILLDCLNKNFTCIDDQGNYKIVHGVPKKISLRQFSALQS